MCCLCRVLLPRVLKAWVASSDAPWAVPLEGQVKEGLDMLALDLYIELKAAWATLEPYHRRLWIFLGWVEGVGGNAVFAYPQNTPAGR